MKEVARLNAGGADIISLGVGGPDMMPPKSAVDTLCSAASDPANHSYQLGIGLPELRRAFAGWYSRYYGVTLDPASEILPLAGSKEGITHISLAFLNPGDRVLVPDPGYPTYTSVSRLVGAEVVKYDLTVEGGWMPDFDALEKSDLSGVKLMWINYPHMPTGTPARRELFERAVDFGRRHGILIVNDNPYSFILNDTPLSILQVDGARDTAIELNSLSKAHNMAGWRIGMVAANPDFIGWILKVKSNIDNGSFRGIQLAAAEAMLNNTDEWHRENNIQNYRRRRDIAEEIMKVLDCQFDPNQVGMFLWGKIPEKYADVEDLTEKVLHEARVFITPGFIFGTNGKRYIRISLCAKDEKMKEALERIKKVFEK